jgi:molybdate-binding protein
VARDHRGVAEAVRSGWADAGICVRLSSFEAGLDFLPVQQEAYDVCFPAALLEDRRLQAFLSVVRSPAYRNLLGALPGYSSVETGNLWSVQ